MKTAFLLLAASAVVSRADTNPLAKVIDLLDSLAAKVTKDGEAEVKAYKDYVEWCDDVSSNTKNDITSLTSQKNRLVAKAEELSASIESSTSKIEDLGNAVAKADAEKNEASLVRKKEAADFDASEAELTETVDTLDRATAILQREMAKNPAALAQIDNSNMAGVIQSLTAIVDAASFKSVDKKKLLALVQSNQQSSYTFNAEDDDDDVNAPAATVYKSQSGSIFDLLEDLKEKATTQLSELRKEEVNTNHNFAMLKQSLEDKIAADTKNMDDEKKMKSEAEQAQAGAEGDLSVTTKDLAAAEDKLATAQQNCMQVAADHEATVASRNGELKAIAEARKILVDTSSGAVAQTYSFLEVSSRTKGSQVLEVLQKLASEQRSEALSQLFSRIKATLRYASSSHDDVFGKVRDLISNLIAKLEREHAADATEKGYCDSEMGKTEAKKGELDDDIEKLSVKIDQASAKSATLKSEVKELQAALAALAKEQADMDKVRSEQKAAYVEAKADLELGLSGVRQALSVLRDYYGSEPAMIQQPEPPMPASFEKAEGAGQSITGILEVVESDFATNLAKSEVQETDSQDAYDAQTQKNAVEKTDKDQSVKYKTQEFTGLDKALSDLNSDSATANTELDAVMEYYGKLKARCIAKPESYAERKTRRAAEISGLKEALAVLEDDTAFVQIKRSSKRTGALTTE